MFDDSDSDGYVPSLRTPAMRPPKPSGSFYDNRHDDNDVESDDENAFPSDFGDNYVSSDSDLLHETMDKTQKTHNTIYREGDSMIWHGIEEDEDSGSDYELLPMKKEKKSITRMRKGEKNNVKTNEYIMEIPIVTSGNKSKLEIERNTKLVSMELVDDEDDESVLIPTEAITDDDGEEEERQDRNSMYVEDFDDFDDFDAKPIPKKNTIPASKRIKKPVAPYSSSSNDGSKNTNMNNDKSSLSPTMVMDEINMDLLRVAFDATYIDEVGANSLEFSRILRSKLNAPNLAEDILALETDTVSWSTVAVLARTYKTYRPTITAPLTALSDLDDANDDKKPTKPAKNVSILEVDEVNNDVTAESEGITPAPVASDSPKLPITKGKPLPTVPTADTQEPHELEKDITPVVSKPLKSVNSITKKKGVFGFTQYQTDESFNDDELDDSNDSIGDTTTTTSLPVSPMRVEIKRAATIPSSEVVPAGDSESKKEIVEQIESILSVSVQVDDKTKSIRTSSSAISELPVAPCGVDSMTVVDTFSMEKKSDMDPPTIALALDKLNGDNDKESIATSHSRTPLKSITATTSPRNTPRRLSSSTAPVSSISVLKSLLPQSKLPVIEAELVQSTVSFPPKLSKLALESGVILEGWLEKKSATTGIWLKRYYVLSESDTDFAILKIYKRAVKSLWGDVPTKLKGILPVSAIASIEVVATKSAKGREFTIVTNKCSQSSTSNYSNMFLSGSSNFFDTGSDKGSVTSETGNGKSLMLRAPDAVTRLTWETYINGAIKLLTEME